MYDPKPVLVSFLIHTNDDSQASHCRVHNILHFRNLL